MTCWDKKTKQRPATAHCYGLIQIFSFPNYFHSTQTTIQWKRLKTKKYMVEIYLHFCCLLVKQNWWQGWIGRALMPTASLTSWCRCLPTMWILGFHHSPGCITWELLNAAKGCHRKIYITWGFAKKSATKSGNQFLLPVERSSLFEHQRWTGSHSWRSELGRYDATQAVLLWRFPFLLRPPLPRPTPSSSANQADLWESRLLLLSRILLLSATFRVPHVELWYRPCAHIQSHR